VQLFLVFRDWVTIDNTENDLIKLLLQSILVLTLISLSYYLSIRCVDPREKHQGVDVNKYIKDIYYYANPKYPGPNKRCKENQK